MKKVFDETVSLVVNSAIKAQNVVGASILVAKEGKVIYTLQAGFSDREREKKVDETTIFRLASMTKPIVSAAALAMVEAGLLDLDSPITDWLPDFKPKTIEGGSAIITVRQLLNHTAGFTYGFLSSDNEPYRSAGVSDGMDESVLSLEENLKRLAKVPLSYNPGTSWCYSVATDVLGAVLEKAAKKSLPDIVQQYVTGPLEMKDTAFLIKDMSKLAVAYADNREKDGPARLMEIKDQVLLEGCGPVNYAPGRITNPKAYPSGGAGMAGTAADYLKFLETIRNGGHPILKLESVKLLTHDSVKDFDVPAAGPGYGFGLGFAVVRDSKTAGTPRNNGSYEWGGVYGTKMFVDPKEQLTVIMLTNTGLEGLTGKFSGNVTSAVYAALNKLESEKEQKKNFTSTTESTHSPRLVGGQNPKKNQEKNQTAESETDKSFIV